MGKDLYNTQLYCFIQYTIILFYTIHNYIVLYNTQLYCFIQYTIILFYTIHNYIVLYNSHFLSYIWITVKPVLIGHLWDKAKVVL